MHLVSSIKRKLNSQSIKCTPHRVAEICTPPSYYKHTIDQTNTSQLGYEHHTKRRKAVALQAAASTTNQSKHTKMTYLGENTPFAHAVQVAAVGNNPGAVTSGLVTATYTDASRKLTPSHTRQSSTTDHLTNE
jgi:hypothetical protein